MQAIFRAAAIAIVFVGVANADEPVFSGPQVGESLASFDARPAFGDVDKVSALDGTADSPLLLVFVHQVTRPSIGLTRLLVDYAATKAEAGIESRLVFLTDDPVETTAFLQRARRALPTGVTPLISTEGIEGPGAYGLNRKMSLTVLVASKGVVTANFPLVQPSVQVDAPKIGHAILKVLGESDETTQPPTLAEMGYKEPQMGMRREAARPGAPTPEQDALYRQMMSPVIQKNATTEEVDTAAAAVEALAAKDKQFRERVYNASRMITQGPRLDNYGTPEAQAYLKKWAKEFKPESGERE